MDVICRRCHGASPEGSVFCSNCGTPLRVAPGFVATWPRGDTAAPSQVTGPVAPVRSPVSRTRAAASHRRQAPWYRRNALVIPLVLLALLVTSVATGAWYVTSRFGTLNELSTPPAEISGERLGGGEDLVIDTDAARQRVQESNGDNPALSDSPDGSIAILMMGVDAPAGEAIDVDVRPDSLSVVFLDGNGDSCRMLSIPRDTRVELPGYGASKINHALSVGGVPYQQLVVEQLLGIDIDYYGLIDFAGLTQLVDAVGGITVTNDVAFTTLGGFEYAAGTLQLDGERALEYARYRGGPDGDFGRQERQQQVVRALLSQGAGLDVVRSAPALLSAVEGHIRTDLGPTEMIDLAQRFHGGCTAQTLQTASLEGTVGNAYDDLLDMELSFVHVESAEVRQKVAWLRG